MIRKLKIKFTVLAMTAIGILLVIIVTAMNVANYNDVVKEADGILSVLTQNKGAFPDFSGNKGDFLPPNMSPETPFESRYFSVFLDNNYSVVNTDTSKIHSVDHSDAIDFAEKVIDKRNENGFVGDYRYATKLEYNGYRIVFLDCGRKLDAYNSFLYTSILMALGGLIIAFVFIFFFAGKIIKPIAESYDKQKRFITDAGHEIKTPLTIINANLDLLEAEIGDNESLSDIAQQTERLRTLTNDLVMLARMEEADDTMQKIEFPISEVVAEAVAPFRNVAIQQGKEFVCNVQPMLTLKGNDKAIVQLVNILMDNALKYSPVGGTVAFNLTRQNRVIYIHTFNTTETRIDKHQTAQVFERFYRTDASRNSETGGSGIGLSVAQAIVNAHGGKIQAWTQDGYSFQITAAFPI